MSNTTAATAPTTSTPMETIKIKSFHGCLAAAVEAAQPDLSYNEPAARRTIRDIDLNCRRAFVLEDNSIMYVFSCDIECLNKFDPFMSCISDSPFRLAFIVGDSIALSSVTVPKGKLGRAFFKENAKLGALAA